MIVGWSPSLELIGSDWIHGTQVIEACIQDGVHYLCDLDVLLGVSIL